MQGLMDENAWQKPVQRGIDYREGVTMSIVQISYQSVLELYKHMQCTIAGEFR